MLIRNPEGSVFHIVYAETDNKKYLVGLCGILLEKEDLSLQSRAAGAYSRCETCRRIQNEQIRTSRAEAFGWSFGRRRPARRKQHAKI